jgi:hypothetical protein
MSEIASNLDVTWSSAPELSGESGGQLIGTYAEVGAGSSVMVLSSPASDAPGGPGKRYRLAYANTTAADGDPFASPFVFLVRVYPADPAGETEIRDWLHGEHFDRQPSTPGVAWGLGYEAVDGSPHFYNLWGIDNPEVPASEQYLTIRDTEWFRRITPAFGAARTERAVYRRVGRGEIGS